MEIIAINPKEYGLEETKAVELTSGLKNILIEREALKKEYQDVLTLQYTEENIKTFKDLRLKIRDNRTKGIEVWHKTNKEFFLTGGRFVDAIKNKEAAENIQMEEALTKTEKYFEKLEKERLTQIHLERIEKLKPYNYEINSNTDFYLMDQNMFDAILLGAETAYKNKLEAERIAEEQRLETLRIEAEEKEKQRLEFERLKLENEAKQKQLEAERLETKKIADAELAEQKRLADIETKKQNEIIAKQKAESDKLQAELKAKTDAELKAKQQLETENKAKLLAEKKAAKAPDKVKLTKWVDSFVFPHSLALESIDANNVAILIIEKRNAFIKWANEQINNL